MRIVLMNWAPIAEGAARGGGVNGYCQGLARALVGRGHEVASLSSGTAYEAAPGAGGVEPGPCRVRRSADWEGVRVYEVVNSPVLAPALPQFRDPLGEVSAPELEREVGRLIGELAPEAVHIQSLEGFSAGCIAAIRRGAPGARIVASLHNYHAICPQVYLMQGHRRPCFSFDAGHACDGCIPTVDPEAEKRRLAAGDPRPAEFQWVRLGLRDRERPAAPAWRGLLRKLRGSGVPDADSAPAEPPAFVPPERWSEAWVAMPARRPLPNTPTPEPPSSRPPNAYAQRRRAMVEALNGCDAVLAVSEFVRRKFECMGVRGGILRTVHIGTRMADEMRDGVTEGSHGQAEDGLPMPPRQPEPIRLAFMGYNNWYKGLPMLLESLDLLVPDVLARFHLHILALGGESSEAEIRALEPRLAGLTFRQGYTHDELPALLAGVDLGLVTSVWWDNGPQTVLEFLACGIPVLGADLGGIPDFIREGHNGLLFRGNDRWDLARRLAALARDPAILAPLRAGVRPPKGMAEHAAELEAIYRPPYPLGRGDEGRGGSAHGDQVDVGDAR